MYYFLLAMHFDHLPFYFSFRCVICLILIFSPRLHLPLLFNRTCCACLVSYRVTPCCSQYHYITVNNPANFCFAISISLLVSLASSLESWPFLCTLLRFPCPSIVCPFCTHLQVPHTAVFFLYPRSVLLCDHVSLLCAFSFYQIDSINQHWCMRYHIYVSFQRRSPFLAHVIFHAYPACYNSDQNPIPSASFL